MVVALNLVALKNAEVRMLGFSSKYHEMKRACSSSLIPADFLVAKRVLWMKLGL